MLLMRCEQTCSILAVNCNSRLGCFKNKAIRSGEKCKIASALAPQHKSGERGGWGGEKAGRGGGGGKKPC